MTIIGQYSIDALQISGIKFSKVFYIPENVK